MPKRKNNDDIRENIEYLKEVISGLEDSLKENIKDKIEVRREQVEEKIKEKPLQSTAMAFGAGLLIGALGVAILNHKMNK